jgi:hypothetical protein
MNISHYIIASILVIFSISFSACVKECVSDIAACKEEAPSNEECLAFFNRWFYNPELNKCEQLSYSGCRQYGFETESECSECECSK